MPSMSIAITNQAGKTINIKPMIRVVQLVIFNIVDAPETKYKDRDGTKYYEEDANHSKLHEDAELQRHFEKVIKRETPRFYEKMKAK